MIDKDRESDVSDSTMPSEGLLQNTSDGTKTDVNIFERIEEKTVSETEDDDHQAEPFSKSKIIKNLLVISIAFVFVFTAFGAMANLQSSLNMESGTGSGSLAIIYATLIISCLLVPPPMIAQFGCKWTIPISVTGYILYMVANFYPVWGTMVPAAILLGIGAAPLWSAKCSYLTTISIWYAKKTKSGENAIINRFFGIFFLLFHTHQIFGNVVVFTVLSPGEEEEENSNRSESFSCGARFCPRQITASNTTTLQRPDHTKIYILCGILMALACLGLIVVILFLDPLQRKERMGRKKWVSPRLLTKTVRHIIDSRYQKLLIPLTLYSGFEMATLSGDFTRSFITCSLGVHHVGYMMLCYGVADALCSYLFGHLVKYCGQIPFFALASILHCGCMVTMLLWEPSNRSLFVFYAIVILWGVGDAVIQPQINSLYGLHFKDNSEAGFANYRLWESIGFVIQYSYNDVLCTSTKLYICMAVLFAGICGYTIVELMDRKQKQRACV